MTMKTRHIAAFVFGISLLSIAGPALALQDNWVNLAPKEKERVLRNYDRWRNLPPQDKERLREEFDRWKQLPKDRRERIKQRWDEQRRNRQSD